MRWLLAGGLLGLAAMFAGLALYLSRPDAAARRAYPAATPEQMLDSLFGAVEKGDPGAVADLIHAPTPEFRAVLDRAALLLDHLDELGGALRERFPTEFEEASKEAASRGGAGLGAIFGGMAGASMSGRGGQNAGRALGGERGVQAILADPFASLRGMRERVSAVVVGEDLAAVQVDGAPALGGLGLSLRRAEGRWWVDLPLQLPMVKKYVPQTPEESQVLAAMVQVIDNAVIDLTSDVNGGKCRNLRDAAGLAGEKAFGPLMLCVIAYDRAMEARAGAAGAGSGAPAATTRQAPEAREREGGAPASGVP